VHISAHDCSIATFNYVCPILQFNSITVVRGEDILSEGNFHIFSGGRLIP
jgi:hypothetical protein